MASERDALLQSITATIADYRQGEISPPTPVHVARWLQQFERFDADAALQIQFLAEIDHILKQTYLSQSRFINYLEMLVSRPQLPWQPELTGDQLAEFWRTANFLRLQGPGHSQGAMLELLDGILDERFGFRTSDCGTPGGPYFYLDDCLFSGRHVRNDVIGWLRSKGELWGQLYIALLGKHRSGAWYTEVEIGKAADDAVTIVEWLSTALDIEDRKAYINNCEVLRPAAIPDDPLVRAYSQTLVAAGYPPILRRPGGRTRNGFFTSEAGRHIVEQLLLRAGAYIRSQAAYPDENMHPLGYSPLKTFGFGALIVTYRNIANNCPLAFWYGDPSAPAYHPFSKWYPLFPPRRQDGRLP